MNSDDSSLVEYGILSSDPSGSDLPSPGKELRQLLNQLLRASNLSMRQVSQGADLPISTTHRIFRGPTLPSLDSVLRVTSFLGADSAEVRHVWRKAKYDAEANRRIADAKDLSTYVSDDLTREQVDAVVKLINALEHVDEAAIRLGNIVLAKAAGQIIARQIKEENRESVERYQDSPSSLLKALMQVRATTVVDSAEARQFSDHYTQAIDSLHSDDVADRIGGVHALRRLLNADMVRQQTAGNVQTIVNMLCGYLRMPYTPPASAPIKSVSQVEILTHEKNAQERQVRIEVQRILAELLARQNVEGVPSGSQRPNIDLDLTGAVLVNLSLSDCFVRAAKFSGAIFNGLTQFRGTTFDGAADFSGGTFNGSTEFVAAKFNNTAEFISTTFNKRAEFYAVRFNGSTEFSGATFNQHTKFVDARFNHSTAFSGATFNASIDFSGATFNGHAEFIDARFNHSAAFKQVTFNDWTDIRTVIQGSTVDVGTTAFGSDRPTVDPFPQLSQRDHVLLAYIVSGLDNTSIANRLRLSPKTIRNMVSMLFAKMEVRDRPELIAKALAGGIRPTT